MLHPRTCNGQQTATSLRHPNSVGIVWNCFKLMFFSPSFLVLNFHMRINRRRVQGTARKESSGSTDVRSSVQDGKFGSREHFSRACDDQDALLEDGTSWPSRYEIMQLQLSDEPKKLERTTHARATSGSVLIPAFLLPHSSP